MTARSLRPAPVRTGINWHCLKPHPRVTYVTAPQAVAALSTATPGLRRRERRNTGCVCGRQGKQTAAPGGTRPPETPRAADGWSASTAVSPGPGPARPTLPSPRRPPQPRTQPSGDPCRPLAASRQLRSPRPGPAARPSPHQPASCSPHGLLPADTRRRPRAVTSGARGGGGAAAHAGRWPREQGQAGPPTDRQTRPPIGGGGAVQPANRMRRRAGPAPLSLRSQSVEERGAAAPQCSVPIAYCPLLNARLPADRLLTAAAPLIPGPRRYSPERIPCHSRSTTRRRRNCLIRAPRWAGCGRDVTPGRSGGGAKRGHAPRPLPRVAMAPGGVGAAGMCGVPTGPDLLRLLGFLLLGSEMAAGRAGTCRPLPVSEAGQPGSPTYARLGAAARPEMPVGCPWSRGVRPWVLSRCPRPSRTPSAAHVSQRHASLPAIVPLPVPEPRALSALGCHPGTAVTAPGYPQGSIRSDGLPTSAPHADPVLQLHLHA